MSKSNSRAASKQSPPEKKSQKVLEYTKLIVSTLLAVFVIRTFIISTYQIPTGSMEDSLLIGDHIIANKFVFGIRTPDWIGIPYTKIGFHTPYFQIPGFRKPKKGDIVIFKYPEDTRDSYVKRCVAVSGDTVEVRDKKLYVNGIYRPIAPDGKFISYQTYSSTYIQPGIFPGHAGNKDNYGPVRVPAVGDTFHFSESNKKLWFERFIAMLYTGHQIELKQNGRKQLLDLSNKRFWVEWIHKYPVSDFSVDGKHLQRYVHLISENHYFMMGDNRDNSYDSRYWGYVPNQLVLGEPVVIYWSWNKNLNWDKFYKKIRWNRFLKLIR